MRFNLDRIKKYKTTELALISLKSSAKTCHTTVSYKIKLKCKKKKHL